MWDPGGASGKTVGRAGKGGDEAAVTHAAVETLLTSTHLRLALLTFP
jgi:hypothetical protein